MIDHRAMKPPLVDARGTFMWGTGLEECAAPYPSSSAKSRLRIRDGSVYYEPMRRQARQSLRARHEDREH
jgi:hypothetical protein